jgi:hypothetical protein
MAWFFIVCNVSELTYFSTFNMMFSNIVVTVTFERVKLHVILMSCIIARTNVALCDVVCNPACLVYSQLFVHCEL